MTTLIVPPPYFNFLCIFLNIDLSWHFLDSTPVNGDSEQKTDDMDVEEKPKSPAEEENNDDAASSPNR